MGHTECRGRVKPYPYTLCSYPSNSTTHENLLQGESYV
nr:MAG TPA: hypothetical protein [Caudoviricetes sp.]